MLVSMTDLSRTKSRKLEVDSLLHSTPGRRRTWGPASQPGVILLIAADYVLICVQPAIMKAVQYTSYVPRNAPHNHVFPSLVLIIQISSQACS